MWRFDVPYPFFELKEYKDFNMGHKDLWLETLSLPLSVRVNKTNLGQLSTRDVMVNLIKIYKYWVNNWIINFPEELKHRYHLVKYEDLLDDNKREKLLNFVNFDLGFKKNREKYVNLEPGAVPRSKNYTQKHTEYYLSEEPEFLNKDTILKINEELGEDLFKLLGYKFKTFA